MARHQDDEKRERILAGAIKAFSHKGYTTTTMKDIAEMAGIAPGSIYTYYQDKEVLFIAAVDSVWKSFHKGLAAIMLVDQPFEAQLDSMLDYCFELLTRLHPLVQGMYQDPHRLNLFHKNIVKLAKLAAFHFERARPDQTALATFDKRSRMHALKIWLSGMIFTMASLPGDRLGLEVARQRSVIRQILLTGQPSPVK